jgi:hypothetical protein
MSCLYKSKKIIEANQEQIEKQQNRINLLNEEIEKRCKK